MKAITPIAAALFAAAVTQAATVTETATIPTEQTPWNHTVTVPRFNSALGTLTKVEISVRGDAEGFFRVENTDPQNPSTADGVLAAEMTVTGPLIPGVLLVPNNSVSFNLDKYDGVLDYAGTSGNQVDPFIANSDSTSGTDQTPNDLSAYATPGADLSFTVDSLSASTASAGSEVNLLFQTRAAAVVTVVYTYNETPPPCTPKGTGTIGYYKKSSHWPAGVTSIVLGCKTYTKAEAIAILNKSVSGDKTISLAQQLIAAKLNTDPSLCNEHSCVDGDIAAADAWLCQYPVCSKVSGSSTKWAAISAVHTKLDDYNNGRLCAPHRDSGCTTPSTCYTPKYSCWGW